MSADHIVAEVVGQLLDLETDDLAMSTPLADIEGWDSVNQMRILVYLEREVGGSLDYDRFMRAVSLADLSAVVAETGTPANSATPANPAGSTA
ncbi:acyl carrier protein [Streptomyces sp. NPDC051569]|uniref:acyl carrier protein n=1 Tax=Streptomyces sp. NPDC051569 TaxID=3365661 RepID=UPI0037AD2127